MRALYISHNGMLEGLGQSQVLPYLRGLARKGVEFDLLSYEFWDADREYVGDLRSSLLRDSIRWHRIFKRRDPRLRAKLSDAVRGVSRALATFGGRAPTIVHGRSYLPTAIGDVIASMSPKTKLLFDCRGMIGDEYVDAGYWTRDRREYRLVKRYEARAFRRADGVVVLTDALQRWCRDRSWFGPHTEVATIPCCVDLERFRFDKAARQRIRRELGIENRIAVVYSGSLGSWYREADLARVAAVMKELAPRNAIAFLLLTQADPRELQGLLRAQGVGPEEVRTVRLRPHEVPAYLSAGDVGLSLIKSCFSKMGSSPTKVAEYLACGMPVIANADIGDQAELACEEDACTLLRSFDDAAIRDAAATALRLSLSPLESRVAACTRVANSRFGLETVGVARYANLYERLAR